MPLVADLAAAASSLMTSSAAGWTVVALWSAGAPWLHALGASRTAINRADGVKEFVLMISFLV